MPARWPGIAFRWSVAAGQLPVYGEADFCIQGSLDPQRLLPEGPFGDHLGYYSLAHDFPVLRVERVTCRQDAIWPFTVVGRPPQEDTVFGQLIHELTGPVIPTVIPGVHAVHAVDAAGVHPLLLAIGSERYVPYESRRKPRELLTQANAILGQGQMSLAKYLLIVDRQDDPQLDIHDVAAFLQHLLCRIDWTRDVHFQTCTTIDTLDYSGTGINEGSKVVWAAVGPPRRSLPTELPEAICSCPRIRPAARSVCPACLPCRAASTIDDGPGGRCTVLRCFHGRECDQPVSACGRGGRQRIHRPLAQQLPVGGLHPQRPGGRHLWDRVVCATEALGL